MGWGHGSYESSHWGDICEIQYRPVHTEIELACQPYGSRNKAQTHEAKMCMQQKFHLDSFRLLANIKQNNACMAGMEQTHCL